METPKTIDGAAELARELGGWPSFHDAEILELHLVRDGQSRVMVELAPSHQTREGERQVVVFSMDDVTGLELAEFNSQNVIGSLSVETRGSSTIIELAPCYGLNGWIEASHVRATCGRAPSG